MFCLPEVGEGKQSTHAWEQRESQRFLEHAGSIFHASFACHMCCGDLIGQPAGQLAMPRKLTNYPRLPSSGSLGTRLGI